MNYKIVKYLLIFGILTSCGFSNKFLQPTKISPDVNKLTATTDTDTTLVTISPDTFQPTFLNKKGDTISHNYSIKSVVFHSSSGNNLNGWFLKPRNTKASITLLCFHGNGGFLFSQYQKMTPLLNYGFQIFLFDYSGYGYSEGKATRKNIIDDAISALKYIRSRNDVNKTKIVVYGQSLGGNLAVIVAPKIESEIDGLVLEGAFSNHKDIAAKRAGFLGRIFVREKNNALKTIKKYHKPLLVIHSTEDQTIPYEMGEKLFDAGNEPKEFFTIKKCHMCGPEFYPKEISLKIKKMVNE